MSTVNVTVSAKGDLAYRNTGDEHLEFFSKAGAMFVGKSKRQAYYYKNDTADILDMFKSAWHCDYEVAMKLLFWLRDCRGGAGNRSGFRKIVTWLADKHPEWVISNLQFIPELGRWDDFVALVGTECEVDALDFWVDSITSGNALAAKWAPRAKRNKDLFNKMRKVAGMGPAEWRKLLAETTNVVETAMCQGDWYSIEYAHVPSVAMARSRNAFEKHDSVRFSKWAEGLASGETTVNASVLFPHDCIRTLRAESGCNMNSLYYGSRGDYVDSLVANGQFDSLPNYMEDSGERIMPICDFSGSMCIQIAGSVEAIDVSMALGLYCSDRVGKDNPFYRKFVPFSTDSALVDWKNETFSIAAQKYMNGYCGTTDIARALGKILDAAKFFNATDEQIPSMLLILSDMQFDCACRGGKNAVDTALDKWVEAGYTKPRIIFWDLVAYGTAPATKSTENVAMVSGFSPSLLKAILDGDDFSPMAVMHRALEKYNYIVVPD